MGPVGGPIRASLAKLSASDLSECNDSLAVDYAIYRQPRGRSDENPVA
jgi:hypothetical protein